jgi:hypothetical protein
LVSAADSTLSTTRSYSGLFVTSNNVSADTTALCSRSITIDCPPILVTAFPLIGNICKM